MMDQVQCTGTTGKGVVVIVDDDPALRSALEFSLGIEGYCVQTYPSGEELLRQADIPATGCLIIDYVLPDMDGLAVIHELRRRRIRLPVILITTHPNKQVREAAAAEGIAIIEKPLLENTLVDGIRAAFAIGSHIIQH
jgi:two-component system, LuxR family, response regulator FixJ